MKILLKAVLIIFIYTGLAMSCDKDDDNTQQQQSTTISQTINTAQSGSWKITYFFVLGFTCHLFAWRHVGCWKLEMLGFGKCWEAS